MSNLVQINPAEFGLTDETAKTIKLQFQPMLDKMVELESEYNAIIVLPIEDRETAKKAKELRSKYVKVRTGTADIHQQQKKFYLNGGRFVDGWKNAQIFASQGKEETLEKIEKYAEIQAKQRIEKLQSERAEIIRPYVPDTTALDLGTMQDDVFDAYLSARKKAHEDKLAAEKKAEEDRIERERLEAEERETQRLENLRLKEEADKREKEIEAERQENARKQDAQDKILAEERAKAESERKRIEAENQAKLDKEREGRQELERKLSEEKAAREKAESGRQAEIKRKQIDAEKLAKAPIKKQMNIWVDSFTIPEIAIENEKKELIRQEFEAFKRWAKTEVEGL